MARRHGAAVTAVLYLQVLGRVGFRGSFSGRQQMPQRRLTRKPLIEATVLSCPVLDCGGETVTPL